MPTLHLLIQGKVQGVFYRASAKEMASCLGLTGWVKNTREGDVEIIATGNTGPLDQFRKWCHKGPPDARVSQVVERYLEEEQACNGFSIIR